MYEYYLGEEAKCDVEAVVQGCRMEYLQIPCETSLAIFPFCEHIGDVLGEFRSCVSDNITSACQVDEFIATTAHNIWRHKVMPTLTNVCGHDVPEFIFDLDVPEEEGCQVPAKCDASIAKTCINSLRPSDNITVGDGCSNYAEMQTCVTDAVKGCSLFEKGNMQYSLRAAAIMFNIPSTCYSADFVDAGDELAGVFTCVHYYVNEISRVVVDDELDYFLVPEAVRDLGACINDEINTEGFPQIVKEMMTSEFANAFNLIHEIYRQTYPGEEANNTGDDRGPGFGPAPDSTGGQGGSTGTGGEGESEGGDTGGTENEGGDTEGETAGRNETEEVNEKCNVRRALFCLQSCTIPAVVGMGWSARSKKLLCESIEYQNHLQCIEESTEECSDITKRKFLEAYNIASLILHLSGVCQSEPAVCDGVAAVTCISQLGQIVAKHGTCSDENQVCRAIESTSYCVAYNLAVCEKDIQSAVMDTFSSVKCLALNVCPEGREGPEPEEPKEEPMACVDPEVRTDEDATCSVDGAMMCLAEFNKIAYNPFRKSNKAACMAFPTMVQCVANNMYCYRDITRGLIYAILKYNVDYIKHYLDCPTEVKSPCIEEEECTYREAIECFSDFFLRLSNDSIPRPEDSVICLNLDLKRNCMEKKLEECSDVKRTEIESMFEQHVTDLAVDCEGEGEEDDFFQCLERYIIYIESIITFKLDMWFYEPKEIPVTDSEEDSGEDCDSKASKGSKACKTSKGSKSTKSSKASSKASSKESSKAGSKSKKSSKESKANSKESKANSKESSKAGSKSKKSSKECDPNKSKGSKACSTEETGSAESGGSVEETRTYIDPDDVAHFDLHLSHMCRGFFERWECLSGQLEDLSEPARTLISHTLTGFHYIIADMCRGTRPFQCPLMADFDEDQTCSTVNEECENDKECPDPWKCCRSGCDYTCTEPGGGESEICYLHVLEVTNMIYQQVFFLFDHVDNGTIFFCSGFQTLMEQLSVKLSSCSSYSQSRFLAIQYTLSNTFDLVCSTPPEPTVCKYKELEACMTTFTTETAAVAESSVICTKFEFAKSCLVAAAKSCDDAILEEYQVNLTAIFTAKNVQCLTIPEIECSLESSQIRIEEGSDKTFAVTLTAAPPCISATCYISVVITIDEDESKLPKCLNGDGIPQLSADKCRLVFTQDNWQEPQEITLLPLLDNKVDGNKEARVEFVATLYTESSDGSVETLIESPVCSPLKVVVVDVDSASICSSVNDPHFRTFDDLRFENHHQGEFTMYRNELYDVEVRSFYVNCGQNSPGSKGSGTCNCGAAIRSNDDTFVIFECSPTGRNPPPTLYQNGEVDPGFQIYRDGPKHIVTLPTGGRVKVQREADGFYNIFLYPSAADKGQAVGLCGDYDGDKTNDLRFQDRSLHTLSDDDLWDGEYYFPLRVTKDWQTKNKALYLWRGVDPVADQPAPRSACLCPSNPTEVGTCVPPAVDYRCTQNLGNEATVTVQLNTNRKKRQAVLNGIADIGDPNLVPTPPTWPVNGITQQQAIDHCTAAINDDPPLKACLQTLSSQGVPFNETSFINNCVADIKLFGDLNQFTDSAIQDARDNCINYGTVTSDNQTAILVLQTLNCPRDCSGHGTCTINSTCECDTDYYSEDCSLNVNDPPTVTSLEENECYYLNPDDCGEIEVYGNNFIELSTLTCHYRRVTVTDSTDDIIRTDVYETRPARFVEKERVVCEVPVEEPRSAFLLYISNLNGVKSTEEHIFMTYDYRCFTCNTTEWTCAQLESSCVEGDKCYAAVEPRSAAEPCYVCDPLNQRFSYRESADCPPLTTTTETPPTTSSTTTKTTETPTGTGSDTSKQDSTETTVIAVSASLAGVCLIALVVVVMVLMIRLQRTKDKKKRLDESSSEGSDRHYQRRIPPGNPYGYPAYIEEPGYSAYNNAGYIMWEPQDSSFSNGIPVRNSSKMYSDSTRPRSEERVHH